MNMLNSLILEGVMTAGLTLDGRFTVETTRSEGGEVTKVVILCKLSPALNSNEDVGNLFTTGSILRCVGRLEMINGELGVYVEHFEKRGARFGKYTFRNED